MKFLPYFRFCISNYRSGNQILLFNSMMFLIELFLKHCLPSSINPLPSPIVPWSHPKRLWNQPWPRFHLLSKERSCTVLEVKNTFSKILSSRRTATSGRSYTDCERSTRLFWICKLSHRHSSLSLPQWQRQREGKRQGQWQRDLEKTPLRLIIFQTFD